MGNSAKITQLEAKLPIIFILSIWDLAYFSKVW